MQRHGRHGVAALVQDGIDVVPVAAVGGHPPRRGVRMGEHAYVFELGEVATDRGWRHAQREPLAEMP